MRIKHFPTKLAALALCAGFAQAGQAITIDFETFPGPVGANRYDDVTTQYSVLGVTFSAVEDGAAVSPEIFTLTAPGDASDVVAAYPSGSRALSNFFNDSFSSATRADVVTIDFDGAASGVEFEYSSLGSSGPSTIFRVYDGSDSSPVDMSFAFLTDNSFYTLTFGDDIGKIEIFQPSDGWTWRLDDLTFDTAGVPAPATLVLVVLGLAGFGRSRCRRI